MNSVENGQAQLATLEDLLVSEFRAYQTLVVITKDERRVLSNGNLAPMLTLLSRKEALLDELERLENSRRATTEEWARAAGQQPEGLTLARMLPRIEPPAAARLGRLREGILALVGQVRDLSHGNRALAVSALERVEAVRSFLISLGQEPTGYHIPGVPQSAPAEPAAALAVEQWA